MPCGLSLGPMALFGKSLARTGLVNFLHCKSDHTLKYIIWSKFKRTLITRGAATALHSYYSTALSIKNGQGFHIYFGMAK